VIAAGGLDLGYMFILGVLATVNPCGFVLLPTYLMYFLGLEGVRPGTQRAAISRALVVACVVALGFFTVFLAIGLLYNAGVDWFVQQSDWISIGIGLSMVVLGVAMIFGFHLSIGTPKLGVGGRDRTVLSMFLYGISYAVASIGCTIGLFASAVLKNVDRQGFVNGVISIATYAIGMGVMLAALTVALATARTGLLTVLRRVMVHLDRIAGVFLVLTGLYLSWYWWSAIDDRSSGVVDRIESQQSGVSTWLYDRGAGWLFAVLGGITLAAIGYVWFRRDRSARSASTEPPATPTVPEPADADADRLLS
jgi:cytochrome c biogenesis protein CcdA